MAARTTKATSGTRTAATTRATKRAPARVKHERAAGISAEAAKKATGCDWDSWFEWLDRKGADKCTHKQIVALVADELENSDWWAQMVTVAYEQARGMRVKHQKASGFSGTASKTLEMSALDAFQWFADQKKRGRWFTHPIVIKRATAPKSLRLEWSDGTPVDVSITAKGTTRCSVACQHDRLKSAAEVSRMKKLWKNSLERLAEQAGS